MVSSDRGVYVDWYWPAMGHQNSHVGMLLGQRLHPVLTAPARVPPEAGKLVVPAQFRLETDETRHYRRFPYLWIVTGPGRLWSMDLGGETSFKSDSWHQRAFEGLVTYVAHSATGKGLLPSSLLSQNRRKNYRDQSALLSKSTVHHPQ